MSLFPPQDLFHSKPVPLVSGGADRPLIGSPTNTSSPLTPAPSPSVEKQFHYKYLTEFRVEQCSLFLQHKCSQHRLYIPHFTRIMCTYYTHVLCVRTLHTYYVHILYPRILCTYFTHVLCAHTYTRILCTHLHTYYVTYFTHVLCAHTYTRIMSRTLHTYFVHILYTRIMCTYLHTRILCTHLHTYYVTYFTHVLCAHTYTRIMSRTLHTYFVHILYTRIMCTYLHTRIITVHLLQCITCIIARYNLISFNGVYYCSYVFHTFRPFTCFYWHFQNQRRRRPVRGKDGHFNHSADAYCTLYDENTGVCPQGDDCAFLHRTAGDTERRYHLRYVFIAPVIVPYCYLLLHLFLPDTS